MRPSWSLWSSRKIQITDVWEGEKWLEDHCKYFGDSAYFQAYIDMYTHILKYQVYVCILYVNTFVNTYVSYVNHIYTTPTDLYKIWSITKPSWHNKNTQQINLSPLTPLKKSPPAPLVVDLIGEEVSRLQWVETTLPKTNHETMRFENPIRIHPPICISMVPSWLSHVSGRSYECQ